MTDRLRDDLAWRRTGDEIVVLDLRTSTYHLVNKTGADLWEQLAKGATVASLSAHLVRTHGVAPEQAQRDAAAFLAGIRGLGFLTGP